MAKISGKWTFNDVLTLVGNKWWVDYLGGGTKCYAITIGVAPPAINNLSLWYEAKDTSIGQIQAYMEGPGWLGNIYKTIDFGDTEQTVDDSFYEWLTANATQVVTLAEKLTIITENVPKVYDAGKNRGYSEGEAKGYAEGESKGYQNGYTDGLNKGGYADGYDAGKQAERDAFWEAYQQGDKRTNYTYAFYGSSWTDKNYNPKYTLKMTGGNQAFQTSNITDTKVPVDITDIGPNGQIFIWANKLVTIRKLIVAEGSSINSQMFTECSALENITIDGVIGKNFDIHWSTKLTADSIRSIIEHLSDEVSGKTLTLSETAVDNADFGGDTIFVTIDGSTSNIYGVEGHFFPDCTIQLAEGESLKVTLDVEDGHHYIDGRDGPGNSDGWYVGMSAWKSEPIQREMIIPYSSTYDERAYVSIYIRTTKAASFNFKVRAVKIDADGNEIDGENLYFVPDGSYSVGNLDGTTYTITSESWDTLEASKPNWTISLV